MTDTQYSIAILAWQRMSDDERTRFMAAIEAVPQSERDARPPITPEFAARWWGNAQGITSRVARTDMEMSAILQRHGLLYYAAKGEEWAIKKLAGTRAKSADDTAAEAADDEAGG